MAVPIIQRDFSYGEIDNIALSSVDSNNYPIGLRGAKKIKNFFVNNYRNLSRAYGSSFLVESQNNRTTRILPFSIGMEESYIVEINKDYVRILNENGVELDENDEEVKFPSIYAEEDLESIYNWAKGGSAFYITHSKYPPQVLRRIKTTSGNRWTFGAVEYKVQLNDDGNNIYCGIPTGISRFQIADKVELIINKAQNKITTNDQNITPYIFQNNVVYRLSYIDDKETLNIAYVKTTQTGTIVSYQVLAGTITDNYNTTKGIPKDTPLPLWEIQWGYDEVEYPNAVCCADQRLFFCQGGFIYGSALGDFTDFGFYENSISSTSPVRVQPFKDNLNQFNWIKEMDSVLYVGTKNEIYRMVKSTSSAEVFISYSSNPLFQENGSSVLPPVFIDSYFLFLTKDNIRFKVAEYNANSQLLKGDYINDINREILIEGVKRITFQAVPNNLIFLLKNNGEVALCNFSTTENFYYGGWARLSMENAMIEDICSIPSKDKNQDVVYFLVKRTINGQVKRYIEKYNDKLSLYQDVDCSNFLHCSKTLSSPFLQQEVNGKKNIGGFDIFKGEKVSLVINGFEVKEDVLIKTDGYFQFPEYYQNLNFVDQINTITCGFRYESYVETSPVEVSFDYRYHSIGEVADITNIKLSIFNKANIEILNRNGKSIYVIPKEFNKQEIFSQKVQTIKCDTLVKTSVYERDKLFFLKIKDNSPHPLTLMNLTYTINI